eukprot:scaffold14697_cov124-Cylindrotheca_fusiformis.AAC.1
MSGDESSGDQLQRRGQDGGKNGEVEYTEQQRPERIVGTPRDVLCGRGFHITNHHGNLQFHLLINKYRESYRKSKRRNEKQRIIRLVINETKKTGARFLKRVEDPGDSRWVELDYKKVYEKVSHTLRLQRINESYHLDTLPIAGNDESEGSNNQDPTRSQQPQQLPQSSTIVSSNARWYAQSPVPAQLAPAVASLPGFNAESHFQTQAGLSQHHPQLTHATAGFSGFQQLPNGNTSTNHFAQRYGAVGKRFAFEQPNSERKVYWLLQLAPSAATARKDGRRYLNRIDQRKIPKKSRLSFAADALHMAHIKFVGDGNHGAMTALKKRTTPIVLDQQAETEMGLIDQMNHQDSNRSIICSGGINSPQYKETASRLQYKCDPWKMRPWSEQSRSRHFSAICNRLQS